jgi:hypothetical protein
MDVSTSKSFGLKNTCWFAVYENNGKYRVLVLVPSTTLEEIGGTKKKGGMNHHHQK